MTDEERALLAACAANPADDLPRLVYADWLDEHARGVQAEFIRCGVRAANLSADRDSRLRSQARADELLAAHRREWDRPLTDLGVAGPAGDPNTPCVVYERGLPVQVTTSPDTFVANGAAIHAVAPTVTRLDMDSQQCGDAAVMRLVACPHLAWVTHLDLGRNGLGNTAATALAASPHLSELRHLDLRINGSIRAAGVLALRDSSHFRTDMTIAVDGFQHFDEDSPSFERFRERVDECMPDRPNGGQRR